ncbi:OLC1v1006372C1 [Oldenlandia corymbosa var. corymbosa]|uniref:OLC1v1006372C1 n=1 Tax=Oldenlandia corymbosa var. corymbosa TaxID=529605 RepID=A0AAV1DH58_OLDCO|nr:OLC1v1006372C1 [Oldenlandia corymbosa var. corymbosa]
MATYTGDEESSCNNHILAGEPLPEALMVDVLARLNIKTLYKFKCVSKSWNHLISRNAAFHLLHREKSLLRPMYFHLVGVKDTLSFTWIDLADDDNCIVMRSDFPRPPYNMVCHPPVCCDLFCFATNWDIYLCNPSIRQVQMLPKPISMDCGPSKFCVDHVIGFGYVSAKGEYSVVNLTRRIDQDYYLHPEVVPEVVGEVLADMCTFRPNDRAIRSGTETKLAFQFHCGRPSWRVTKHPCPRWVKRDGGFVVGGNMYWQIAYNNIEFDQYSSLFYGYIRRENELILCLDIENEEFGIIAPPPGWATDIESMLNNHVWVNLLDIKDTLCVTDVSIMVETSVLEIWALREAVRNEAVRSDGDSRIWVKDYCIKMDIPLPTLQIYQRLILQKSSSDGDIVMVSPLPDKLYIFNVEKGCLVKELNGKVSAWSRGFCWESFLSL